MTVREAGRKGGAKVIELYGKERMVEIGSMGGRVSPTKFQKGDARTLEASSKGGHASGGNFAKNIERAREAGRKGGAARKAQRLAAQGGE